jgi:hypothetical protein
MIRNIFILTSLITITAISSCKPKCPSESNFREFEVTLNALTKNDSGFVLMINDSTMTTVQTYEFKGNTFIISFPYLSQSQPIVFEIHTNKGPKLDSISNLTYNHPNEPLDCRKGIFMFDSPSEYYDWSCSGNVNGIPFSNTKFIYID